MRLSDTAILNINGADYCCIMNEMSKIKNVAINLLQNADLTEKSETLRNIMLLYYV